MGCALFQMSLLALSDCEAGAPFTASSFNDSGTIFSSSAGQKTMSGHAFLLAWLVGSLWHIKFYLCQGQTLHYFF